VKQSNCVLESDGICLDWAWWIDLPAAPVVIVTQRGMAHVKLDVGCNMTNSSPAWSHSLGSEMTDLIYLDRHPQELAPADLVSQLHGMLTPGGLLVLKRAPDAVTGMRGVIPNGSETYRRALRSVGGFRLERRIYALPRGGAWITSPRLELLLLHVRDLGIERWQMRLLAALSLAAARLGLAHYFWPYQFLVMEKRA